MADINGLEFFIVDISIFAEGGTFIIQNVIYIYK